MKKIINGAYLLPLGMANAVLFDGGAELVFVDAGFPNRAHVVWEAFRQLGRKCEAMCHLIFTHGHPDHIGIAAAIVRETGATGGPFRLMTPSPQLLPGVICRFVWKPEEKMESFAIDRHMSDGDVLPIAGGLKVIGIPGHCAGQVAFLWQGERLLIAGDVGTNMMGIADTVGFEDEAEGRLSQRKIAALKFDAVAFGHGRPIRSGASGRIRKKWG